MKEKIAEELKRLQRIGVLKKVEFSDWATPIVPVLKPDGTVRICGDYKVTINPVLDVPEYPMPMAEELFTQLNGGEKFSKLDLSSQQSVSSFQITLVTFVYHRTVFMPFVSDLRTSIIL